MSWALFQKKARKQGKALRVEGGIMDFRVPSMSRPSGAAKAS